MSHTITDPAGEVIHSAGQVPLRFQAHSPAAKPEIGRSNHSPFAPLPFIVGVRISSLRSVP